MKKYLIGLFAFAIMLFPMMVNAEVITTVANPEYDSNKDIFAANGTPIVIEERDGSTYATWEGGEEQLLTNNTIVIGGYYNPYTDEVISLELDSTSITMNSGRVGVIVGGHAIIGDANYYNNYDKIYVGNIKVDINGGTVSEITAVSSAISSLNTAIPSSKYGRDFYYADNVDVDINDATVNGRVIALASYVYAKNITMDIDNSTIGKNNNGISVAAGTNGIADKFVVNINDSTVDGLSIGQRVMVEEMEASITGTSIIGDIYAGSYYAASEHSDQSWWNTLGNINYGQVGKNTYNFGEGVKYNNVYAGFQFVDMDEFNRLFADNSATAEGGHAEGIANSEEAPVVINTYVAPSVTDSDLESMFASTYTNVTVNYITTPELPTIDPEEEVEEPVFGVVDTGSVDTILGESIVNDDKVTDALNKGQTVTSSVEVTTMEDPSEEEVSLVTGAIKEKAEDAQIVGYYDISVLIKAEGQEIGQLTNLVDPITLTIVLPVELQEVEEGYTRTYYVVRVHNGVAELLETSLASDGKSLTFETDKFSTYALTYVDTLASSETPTTPENPSEETPEVPQTFDSLTTYMIGGGVSIAAIAGAVIYIKRKQTN